MTSRGVRFSEGDSLTKLTSKSFLNDLLSRIERLENLAVSPPLHFGRRGHNFFLRLMQDEVGNSLIPVRLQSKLSPYCTAIADVIEVAEEVSTSSSSTSSGCDLPIAFTGEELTVIDLDGVTSLGDTNGWALKLPANPNDYYQFIPHPLGEGDNLPNYKWDEQQILGHMGQGWLQWIDVVECESTSTSGV